MPEVILPCPNPKCGSKFVMTDTSPSGADIVKCCTCFMHGPYSDTEESAIAAWNALPRALTWTHEPPKVAGWYFIREKWASGKWRNHGVMKIYADESGILQVRGWGETSGGVVKYGNDFEWAGPIAPPVD